VSERRLLLWLPAPLLAWWCSAQVSACPTPVAPLVGGGLVLLVGVWLATAARAAWVRWCGALVAVGAATWLPLARMTLVPGLPHMHDLPAHAWALWGTAQALQAGELWPRWTDALGFGMPVGSFYPPVPYLLGAAPIALGLPWPQAVLGLDVVASLLGAAGVAWVVRARGGAGATCLLAAVAFVLAPYRLLDQGYRFALGELFGLALIAPCWHLLATLAQERGTARTLPTAAAVVGALALSHALSLVTAGFGALVWAAWSRPTRRGLVRAAAAALLGLGLAGAQLVPASVEQGEVRVAAVVPGSPMAYRAKALHPGQALRRQAWNGLRISPTLAEEEAKVAAGLPVHDVPYYLGWVLVWPVLLTLLPGLGGSRRGRALAVVAVGCLLATWAGPAWLLGHLAPVRALQFPWRFLGPASVAAVLVFAAWFDPLLRSSRGPGAAVCLSAALALDASTAFDAPAWIDPAGPGAHHVAVATSPTCDPERPVLGYEARVAAAPAEAGPAPVGGPRTEGAPWRGYPSGALRERVTGVYLPPVALGVAMSKVHRAQPEFFTPELARRVVRGVAEGSALALAEAGVSKVVRAGGVVEARSAWPRVRLHTNDGVDGLRAELSRPSPSQATLRLPVGHPGGLLVWTEQASPGWTAQVDGAPVPLGAAEGWLAVAVPADARVVRFVYGASTPARQAGLAWSVAALLGWVGLLVRARGEGR
jgi:hypothetical protein